MKKSNTTVTAVVFTLAAFLMFSSFKNEKKSQQPSEPIKPGFYMNNGCTKVDSITCYGYSDFYFIHEITPEMLVYDKIAYELSIASNDFGYEEQYVHSIDGKVFKAIVGEKSFVKIPMPDWNLKQTTRKERVNNSYFMVTIYGLMISGYDESWNDRTNSVEKTPVYKKKTILAHGINLYNRAFYKRSFFSSFSSKGMEKSDAAMPVDPKSPDCYPCIGEKPEVFEFNAFNY
ncbi:MAG: hypothetical protein KF704_02280 [Crocinitomicaceae bacterium]|nr:hypothetical protein [Crocinitomicaceae bacterium]